MSEKIATKNPLVSIVVLNWNGLVYLEKCLQSLQFLKYPNCEIIVVDNGSSDGSPEMVKENFKNIQLIINNSNLGFAKGSNVGIKASKGDLVVLLNNDMVVDPCWMSELVKATLVSPRIGMTSGIVLQREPFDVVSEAGKKMDVFTGNTWRVGYGDKYSQLKKVDDIDYFSGGALLVRREVIRKIGLLDEGYFFTSEDADWSFCARRAGFDFALAPLALVWHEGSATRKRVPKTGYYWHNRSAFRLYFIHFPIVFLFTSVFFRIVISSLLETLVLKRQLQYISLRIAAFGHTLLDLQEIMKARRKVNRLGKLALKIRLEELLKVGRIDGIAFSRGSSTRVREVQ